MTRNRVFKRPIFSFLLPLSLLISACGSDSGVPNIAKSSSEQKEVVNVPTINADSLQKISFNYQTSQNRNGVGSQVQSAFVRIDLPDKSKTAAGNLLLALDVIEPEGIEQIILDFSNNDPDILALQVCGTQITGSLLVANEDTGEAVFAEQASTAGAWTYTLDNGNATVQALIDGDTLSNTFSVMSIDGTDSQVVTVTITSINGAATITGTSTGAATEDVESAACLGSAIIFGSKTETQYRVFINGINPHDFGWHSGDNVINVWVDSKQGNRSLATSFEINWQAVSVDNTQAEFSNVVTGQSTSISTGDLSINWSPVADYLFYNVFIATEQGVTSKSFTNLTDGQARLSLETNSVVFSNLDASKQYYYTVSAVDDSGESAFSIEKSVRQNNDVPTLSGTFGVAITEGDAVKITGQLTVTDLDDGESAFVAQDSVLGTNAYGIFNLLANGNWTYDLDNTNTTVAGLSNGGTLSDTFEVISFDRSVSQDFTVTITAANGIADITGMFTGAATEDNDSQITGSLSVADEDTGEAVFAEQALTPGTYGDFTLATAGDWTYTLDNKNTTVQALIDGATLSDSFTAISIDGTGSQVVTVTITGINDIATITGTSTGEATERDDTPVSGTLIATDEDTGQAGFTAQPSTLGDSGYGTFTLLSDGQWTYDVDNTNSAVLALNDGDNLNDTFSAISSDGTGLQVVTVTINGLNDAPVFAPATIIDFTAIDIDTDAGSPVSVFSIDVDGDGDMDVLSASNDNNTIAWFDNDGNVANPGFTKRVITSDANGAVSVFAIDVDGDGDMDVLSASLYDATIAWYDNDGNVANPGFTKRVITSDANGAVSVFAIDVDGDGDMDILSANSGDNTIAWYENDGNVVNPGFTKRVITTTADGASSVFAIDVDGDSDMDVLSASIFDDTIAWYENDGNMDTPGFTKRVISNTADGARSVLAIDVDGDGDMDVLSASLYDDTIAWYENDGTVANPGFTKRVITNTADGAFSVFAIDVDGDGDMDVLSASLYDDTIASYENDGNVGNPGFTKRVITSDANGAVSVFAIDVEGDGDMDVLSASREDDIIAWYDSRAGNFAVPENTTSVGDVLATDADDDIITYGISTSADQALFSIESDTGALRFISAPNFEAPGSANNDNTYRITVTVSANADVVSSAVVIVVSDANDTNDATTISGTSTGEATERNGTPVSGTLIATDEDISQAGFTAQPSTLGDSSYGTFTLLSNGQWTYDVDNTNSAVLALNDGDNLNDTFSAIFSDGTGLQVVTVTINGLNDAPVFTPATIIDFTAIDIATDADGAHSVFAIDVDGDGDIDALSASFLDNTIAWYENDGNVVNPGFTKRVITTTADGASSVFAIDVDGDGDMDVLSASIFDDTIAWYENDGNMDTPGFTKRVISNTADGARSVLAIDVDGDGDMDVLSASLYDDTIAWYENDGTVANPGFTKRVVAADADEAVSVFAIDVDGDGDMDVLSASSADNTIAWYENDGSENTPAFTKQSIATDADGASSVFAIDVDGDGDMDVLSASFIDNTIAWYDNAGTVANPGFTKRVITSDANGAVSVFAIDVDGDGDMDVLSASLYGDTIAWYENDGNVGNPGFTKRVITNDADAARSVFAIDVNSDGDIDVLSASDLDDTIAWYDSRPYFSVPENTTSVGDVLATDADGDGDIIAYGISTGADQALFSIESDTGALRFISAPNFEAPGSANNDNTYRITVTASANADVVSSAVVIVVTDAEEAP